MLLTIAGSDLLEPRFRIISVLPTIRELRVSQERPVAVCVSLKG
ncbi:MAG TPA: hypothetical protein VHF01_04555 [Candidatus Acidoferrum sp.]|nr:hypothetical protein [Candidatus Acidoferrum sp.]